jgi:ribosomal protein L35AE/L33A
VHYKARNNTGTAIPKGTLVKATGSQSGTDYINITPTTSTSDVAIGVVHSTIDGTTGWIGLVVNTGVLDDTNTSSYTVGQILYTGTSGAFTTTKPTTGNYQASGYVLRSHSTQGTILVEFTEPSQYNNYYTKTELDTVLSSVVEW